MPYSPPYLMPYGVLPRMVFLPVADLPTVPPGSSLLTTPAVALYPYGSHVTSSSPPHHLFITCFHLVIPDFPECLPPVILAFPHHLLYFYKHKHLSLAPEKREMTHLHHIIKRESKSKIRGRLRKHNREDSSGGGHDTLRDLKEVFIRHHY